MRKNLFTVLMIFIVPLALYWGLTKDNIIATPSVAAGAEIIKFSAPMCYECIELEKVFKEVYPNYSNKVTLQKIDTTKKSNQNNSLIKQYEVKLVPTTIFKNSEGQVLRRIEGSMQPRILENYIKEIIND